MWATVKQHCDKQNTTTGERFSLSDVTVGAPVHSSLEGEEEDEDEDEEVGVV